MTSSTKQPEDPDMRHLHACLKVLEDGIVAARFLARQAASNPTRAAHALSQIGDLLDAMHNLPKHAYRDDAEFRSWVYARLEEFDTKHYGSPYLARLYDEIADKPRNDE